MYYVSLPVIFLIMGAAFCAPDHVQIDQDSAETQKAQLSEEDHSAFLQKRSPHYDFGLGKRAYSYVSEYKRLPVYNFGLGKRSRPYSFGLGKRSVDEESADNEINDLDPAAINELFENYDDTQDYEKRARPFNFGLGKRLAEEDPSEEKRARMYDFGLGKRVPLYNFGLGKRARNSYNFGLGKRLSKYEIGLGKRQRDLHKYSFGLGKRSIETMFDENNTLEE